MSYARLDVWARAQIVAYADSGLKPQSIVSKVTKKDGSRPQLRAVQKTILKKKNDPEWRGQNNRPGPGRPGALTETQINQLYNLVMKERGSAVVTIKYCKKYIPSIRNTSRWAISRALHTCGLWWLRCRKKRWVRKEHLQLRLAYARWILRQPRPLLRAFAFIDGTTYYLARGPAEAADKQRGRLGAYVWRMSTAADGLYNDCVGPSLYAAKQGRPVKVWGFLSNGKLCIYVLEPHGEDGTEHMNGPLLRWMISRYAEQWIGKCWRRKPARIHLVMDYETCLRQAESIECFQTHGLHVLRNYPKSSQELNPIENVWALLRDKLEAEAPAGVETREDFILRLRSAVRCLNTTRNNELKGLCFDLPERAQAVLDNGGGRIDW